MDTVTILWSIGAASAFTLALVCGVVWLIERRDPASLMLCILGVATAVSAFGELGMLQSATAVEYGEWLRWYYLPVSVALIAMVLFVHYYLGTGSVWLMWTVIFARLVVAVVNFTVHPNFAFSSIISLRSMELLGQQVSTIGVAIPSGRQWFAVASSIPLVVYLLDAAARGWLSGTRETTRKAVAVGLGIAFPFAFNFVYVQLMVFGVLGVVWVSNLPWFLAALVLMACELGRDFILSRRARLELAELRNKLTQVERVSLLGQLASTLAHELIQPLAATAINVDAARRQLQSGTPDLEELRSIVDDIGSDERRAAEIIARMRQLFKRRAIEMQPVSVEDVVQDVVALVRAEMIAKNVVLSLRIPPALPRVMGDRVHLSQVLLNLVMNSIHALQSCPIDARHITVEARTDARRDEIEMVVQDSGPGIPGDMVHKVFESFFTTKPEGMGMGLALCRTIIEAHGGRILTEQLPPQDGAIFRFTLKRVVESSLSVLSANRIVDAIHGHIMAPKSA